MLLSFFHSRLSKLITWLWICPLILLLSMPFIVLLSSIPHLAIFWNEDHAQTSTLTALVLSLKTSTFSTLLILLLGTPMAWLLAHLQETWANFWKIVLIIPMFLPPSIVGVSLLSAFHQDGLLSTWLPWMSTIPFSTWAVICAQVTVSAPLYILGSLATFKKYDPALMEMARTLGLNAQQTWLKVTLPLTLPGLLIALSLAWSRSLGEFGATLLFAGHLPGVTQTAPLAIYLELDRGTEGALALSLALILCALPILGSLLWLGRTK